MLEGKTINLRVAEKTDLPLIGEWRNNPESQGEQNILIQESKDELEKRADRWIKIIFKDEVAVILKYFIVSL